MKKFELEEIKNKTRNKEYFRTLLFDRSTIDEEKRTVEISVTSEYEYATWFGVEILDHKRNSVRLERFKDGAAVRDEHWGDQIGVVEDAWIDTKERKLRCRIRFSKNNDRAETIFRDIVDGIRRNVSVRYIVHEIVLEKETDENRIYRVTDWEPIHIAIEPDPADPTVGVGRSLDNGEELDQFELSLDNPQKSIEDFNKKNKNRKIQIIINNKDRSNSNMTDEEKRKLKEEQDAALEKAKNEATVEARTAETLRIRSIYKIAEDYQANLPGLNLREEAGKYVDDPQKTVGEFSAFVMGKFKDPTAVRTPETNLGLSDSEMNDYSMRLLILHQVFPDKISKEDRKKVDFMISASRALEEKIGKNAEGIFIPDDIQQRRRVINLNKLSAKERDLIVGSDPSGGYLIKDQYIAQSFIEVLVNSMALKNLNPEILMGLTGDIPLNRELDDYSFTFHAETAGPSKSSITFGRETATPHKGGALARYSYEFLMQASIAVEAYVERRLARRCARGVDYYALYGSGSTPEPRGVANWTGIGGVVGTNFDRDKALDLIGQIYTGNADELGTPKWLSRGAVKTSLQKKKIDAGSGLFLVSDKNDMIGYDYSTVSSQVAAGELFFGIWSQLMILYWNQLDILANKFHTDVYAAGDVYVRALLGLDYFLLNPAALTRSTGVN